MMLKHQPQHPQAGVPQAEHRRGPAVGDHLAGLAGQILERVDQIVGTHRLIPRRVDPGPPAGLDAAVRCPARSTGRAPVGRRGRSSTGRCCHCIRSQWPYPIRASTVIVARTSNSTQATTQSGPSTPLTCPAAGTAITVAERCPSPDLIRAASRKAWTLPVIGHCSIPTPPGIAQSV